MKKAFSALALTAAIVFGSVFAMAQDKMTNDEVISLTKAGLASSIIIGKINSTPSSFDTSTDALITLKKEGVTDEVVAAMMQAKAGRPVSTASAGMDDPNDPASKHNFGIYMFEEKDGVKKMTQLQPTMSGQNRTGGQFTAAVTPFGLGKVKTKTNLPGRNAALQLTTTTPVFYFYLDNASGGLNTASGIPSSPKEFTLVRFNQRSDNREVTIAKANSWGAKGGLSDEYVVGLNSEDLGNGVYKITPASPLKKGEYGFYLLNSGNSNTAAGVGSKFFDFGVMMTP